MELQGLTEFTLKVTGESSSNPYAYNLDIISQKIRSAINSGITSFYLLEKEPSFDIAIEELSKYPRNSIFLITSSASRHELTIVTTPLGYYDLILLPSNPIIGVVNPNHIKEILFRHWQDLNLAQKEGLTRLIGLEDFYPKQIISLMRVIGTSGFSSPSLLLSYNPEPDLIRLARTFNLKIMDKVPIDESDIKIGGVEYSLLLPEGKNNDIQAQSSAYSNTLL